MRNITKILLLSFLSVIVCFTSTAEAVIPQLIGPLTALLAIIPQILAFVGVAIITSLVFARDTTKSIFYKIRGFFTMKRSIISVMSLFVLVGLAILTFYLVDISVDKNPTPIGVSSEKTAENKARIGSAWTTFRGNANRTGRVDELSGPIDGNALWVFKAKRTKTVQFLSSPAVVGNRLYISAAVGSVFSVHGATYCIDTDKNEVVWEKNSEIPIFSSPAVVAGRVYIGEGFHLDSGCRLRCLDATTGEPIWSFTTASHVESTPFITKGRLYFTAGADGVYCLDALAGEEIWHFPAVHADMSPLVMNGKVYFGTGYDGYTIYAVDAGTGEEIWSTPMPYPVWGTPSGYENLVYFGMGRGDFSQSAPVPAGKFVALDGETGDIVWEYEAGDAVLTAAVVHNSYVTFGSRTNFVYTLNALDGEIHWKKNLGSPILSSPAVTEQSIYVATYQGKIYALSVEDGHIQWEYDSDSDTNGVEFISSPAIANEKLYIGSGDRYIFCIGKKDTVEIVGDR